MLACLQQGLAHGSRAAGPQVLRHLLCVRGGEGRPLDVKRLA